MFGVFCFNSAEQCVKLLEHVCQRETSAVYDAGGLQCMLNLVRQHGQYVHKVMLFEIAIFNINLIY